MLHFLLILFDLFWCFWLVSFCPYFVLATTSMESPSLPLLSHGFSFCWTLIPFEFCSTLFQPLFCYSICLPLLLPLFLFSLLSFTSKMRLLTQIRFYPLLSLLGLLDVLCCLFVLALSFSWGGFKQIKIELFRTVSKELGGTSSPARAMLKIEGTKLSNTA